MSAPGRVGMLSVGLVPNGAGSVGSSGAQSPTNLSVSSSMSQRQTKSAGKSGHRCVKAAAMEQLFSDLNEASLQEGDFIQTFLTTYPYFTRSTEIVQALIGMYRNQSSEDEENNSRNTSVSDDSARENVRASSQSSVDLCGSRDSEVFSPQKQTHPRQATSDKKPQYVLRGHRSRSLDLADGTDDSGNGTMLHGWTDGDAFRPRLAQIGSSVNRSRLSLASKSSSRLSETGSTNSSIFEDAGHADFSIPSCGNTGSEASYESIMRPEPLPEECNSLRKQQSDQSSVHSQRSLRRMASEPIGRLGSLSASPDARNSNADEPCKGKSVMSVPALEGSLAKSTSETFRKLSRPLPNLRKAVSGSLSSSASSMSLTNLRRKPRSTSSSGSTGSSSEGWWRPKLGIFRSGSNKLDHSQSVSATLDEDSPTRALQRPRFVIGTSMSLGPQSLDGAEDDSNRPRKESTSRCAPSASGTGGSERKTSAVKICTQLTLRAFHILRQWVKNFPEDFDESSVTRKMLMEFISDVSEKTGTADASIAKVLQSALKTNRVPKCETESSVPDSFIDFTEESSLLALVPYPCSQVAKQLTVGTHQAFCRIRPRELCKQAWKSSSRHEMARNVCACIERCNKIGNWVMTEILAGKTPLKRSEMIEKLIRVAYHCLELHNLNDSLIIVYSLRNSAIERLTKSWRLVPSKVMKMLEDIKMVCCPSERYIAMRTYIHACEPPCVPYIGAYLDMIYGIDVTMKSFNGEGNVNFNKMAFLARQIREFVQFQQDQYTKIESDGTFEDYFTHGLIISNEDTIFALSLELEPRESRRHSSVDFAVTQP